MTRVPVLSRWFDLTLPSSGGSQTVNVGSYSVDDSDAPFVSRHAAAFRAIYDFADLEHSVFLTNTGQSGHVLSPHYRDWARRFAAGGLAPMITKRAAVEQVHWGRCVLRPFSACLAAASLWARPLVAHQGCQKPAHTVGEVLVSGNSATADRTLLALLPRRPPAEYSSVEVAELERRLITSGSSTPSPSSVAETSSTLRCARNGRSFPSSTLRAASPSRTVLRLDASRLLAPEPAVHPGRAESVLLTCARLSF